MPSDVLDIHPLTADRWPDLEDLFGPLRGANSGCWCMWPRVRGADYKAMEKAGRKDAFQSIVGAGPPPGLLAYQDGKAVGWCAVGPRTRSARFHGAKASQPLESPDEPDAAQVYAITCFFIRTGYRKQGLTRRLIDAALDFAKANGATAVDACPIDPEKPLTWGEGFVGIASVFASLGFKEIARRSPRRPLMRLSLRSDAADR
jgi:GNAT superfamily N-acetyltransferase